jgi:glycosyltransferase involved in cell wall biosynthesis
MKVTIKKENPLLSIITVCLNEPKIELTCESIVNQTFQNFEWIVIDGGSNPETLSILDKYKYRTDYFVSEKDMGIYDAMNKGIKRSSGTWLNFMNAGDWYISKTILGILHEMLEICEEIDVLYGETIRENFALNTLSHTPNKNLLEHLFVSSIRHQASFIKRTCFMRYGYYNTSAEIISDHIFFINLCRNNAKFLRLPYIIAVMSIGGISTSIKHAVERNRIMKNLFSAEEFEKLHTNKISFEQSKTKILRAKHMSRIRN